MMPSAFLHPRKDLSSFTLCARPLRCSRKSVRRRPPSTGWLISSLASLSISRPNGHLRLGQNWRFTSFKHILPHIWVHPLLEHLQPSNRSKKRYKSLIYQLFVHFNCIFARTVWIGRHWCIPSHYQYRLDIPTLRTFKRSCLLSRVSSASMIIV